MSIPEISVKKPVTVTMMILIIVVLGMISYTRLGLDMMPNLTFPILSVIVNYSGVAPEEVESIVTKPVEEICATVNGVKKLNSFSQEGISAIMIEFEWGTSLDAAAQDIRDRIEMYKEFLPEDMKNPMVVKFDISMMPVIVYGITGNRDLFSLRKVTDDMIKDRLEQVDGVASAIVFGGYEKEILIELKKSKLESYKLSLDQVVQKLRMENMNLPGGYVVEGYKEYLLRTKGELKNSKEIKNIVLGLYGGIPVYIKDIGTVKDTHKELRSYARTNKRNSVMFMINKESGANTVIVSNRVNKELKKIKNNLPQDIKMHIIFDQARIIKRIVSVTGTAAILGGVLAAGILFFFLANWRPTLVVSLGIPLSILAAFIPLYFLGHTLNFITMIGIALGVGMLVDNSIVVIESIYRHLREGKDSINASIVGATEVGRAITASTLTTAAVFLPLIFATGITGKLFWPLALTVSFTLIASLFVALTIVPMLTSKVFKGIKATESSTVRIDWEKKFTSYIQSKYRVILTWVLANRLKVILGTFAVLVLSILLAVFFMGKEFFPKMDHNMMTMMVKLPVGITYEETNRVVEKIENILMKEKELETVSAIVGIMQGGEADAAYGTGPAGGNEAQIYIRLKEKKDRKRVTDEIMNDLRSKIPKSEKLKIEFFDMGSMMMTGGGGAQKPIEIKIYGKDLETLDEISQEIMNQLEIIKGIHDAESNLIKGKPEVIIEIDREKVARFGLSVAQVASAIQAAFQGKVATRIRHAGEEINVRVRLEEKERKIVQNVRELPITTMTGTTIPLKEVTKLSFTYGPIKLYRENQKRTITVTANLTGRDLGGAINEIKSKVSKIFMPEGYFVDYTGEAEQMRETFTDLAQIFALALLLIYMVMAAEFESLLHPFVIMFTVPLSIIGVIICLFIAGKPISLPIGMGLLILSGIIVNNGIVLIDYVNQLRQRGVEKTTAIIEGCITRLRPVLMTAITTVLGLIPMVVSRAQGSEMRSVVAITLIGGLVFGTVLTLIVEPVIYSLFERKK